MFRPVHKSSFANVNHVDSNNNNQKVGKDLANVWITETEPSGMHSRHASMLLILLFSVLFLCLMAGFVVCNLILVRKRYQAKKITVIAEKSFIIRKKIILENGGELGDETNFASDPKKEAEIGILSPMVKIDYEPIQVDSASEELAKCGGVQYELPLDSEWEMDRTK